MSWFYSFGIWSRYWLWSMEYSSIVSHWNKNYFGNTQMKTKLNNFQCPLCYCLNLPWSFCVGFLCNKSSTQSPLWAVTLHWAVYLLITNWVILLDRFCLKLISLLSISVKITMALIVHSKTSQLLQHFALCAALACHFDVL